MDFDVLTRGELGLPEYFEFGPKELGVLAGLAGRDFRSNPFENWRDDVRAAWLEGHSIGESLGRLVP